MRVELIYEQTCPNVDKARDRLREAFSVAGLAPQWREWEVSQADTPVYARHYGSPTILVNQQDVSASPSADQDCCRIYSTDDGQLGVVPKLDDIVAALQRNA